MTDELRIRIAAVLGWTVADTQSVSIPSLRELVRCTPRPEAQKLYNELTQAMREKSMLMRPFCGTCGKAYVHGRPVCLNMHPTCIAIGTEDEAEERRIAYAKPPPASRIRQGRRQGRRR